MVPGYTTAHVVLRPTGGSTYRVQGPIGNSRIMVQGLVISGIWSAGPLQVTVIWSRLASVISSSAQECSPGPTMSNRNRVQGPVVIVLGPMMKQKYSPKRSYSE